MNIWTVPGGALCIAVAMCASGLAAAQSPPENEGPAATPTPQPARGASGSFYSNLYNPALSANGLFLATGTQEAAGDLVTGVAIQEVEVQLSANVDPYFFANLTLSLEGGSGIGVEEGYVIPAWQPGGLRFRLGKIKVPFGRENAIHTHALPFIDKSMISAAALGEDGLNEVGVETSWLSPLPWYSTFTLVGMNGDNDILFNAPLGDDFAGLAAWTNLFDLTDDATLEAGASYTAGLDVNHALAYASAAHLVIKWRPARHARTRSAQITGEVIYAHHDGREAIAGTNVGGAYGFAQWQLAQRWFVAGRFDYLGFPATDTGGVTRRESAVLTFAPTEFSALRLQASVTHPPGGEDPFVSGFLQVNFTVGAHPAHSY